MRRRTIQSFRTSSRIILFITLLSIPAAGNHAAGLGTKDAGLPWTKLELSAKKFFLKATSTIEMSRVPACEALRKFRNLPRGHTPLLPGSTVDVIRTSASMPFGRFEQTTTWIDAATGAVLQTEKLASGSRMYWKLRRFGRDGYFQWRRAPANVREEKLPSQKWSKVSARWFAWHPAPPPGTVVTSSYALLALLSRAGRHIGKWHVDLFVSSHGHLVNLHFTSGKIVTVHTRFLLTANGRRTNVPSIIEAQELAGTASWFGDTGRKEPAETGFMGMRGPLTVLLQRNTGIPLRVTGTAKGIGRLVVHLRAATLPAAAD